LDLLRGDSPFRELEGWKANCSLKTCADVWVGFTTVNFKPKTENCKRLTETRVSPIAYLVVHPVELSFERLRAAGKSSLTYWQFNKDYNFSISTGAGIYTGNGS
jgi:hypothetical protein